jgi:hypothetical protein
VTVDEKNAPLAAGEYAFHQGDVTERGQLATSWVLSCYDPAANGRLTCVSAALCREHP